MAEAKGKSVPQSLDLDDNFKMTATCNVIRVTVEKCVQVGERAWDVYVPCKILTNSESDILDKLFPNTTKHIERALSIEALCSAVK